MGAITVSSNDKVGFKDGAILEMDRRCIFFNTGHPRVPDDIYAVGLRNLFQSLLQSVPG